MTRKPWKPEWSVVSVRVIDDHGGIPAVRLRANGVHYAIQVLVIKGWGETEADSVRDEIALDEVPPDYKIQLYCRAGEHTVPATAGELRAVAQGFRRGFPARELKVGAHRGIVVSDDSAVEG